MACCMVFTWHFNFLASHSPSMHPAGDFMLASAAPLHAMLQEGIVDRNVRFTPVLDGYRMPEYIDWELQPFSNHKVMHTLCLLLILMFRD